MKKRFCLVILLILTTLIVSIFSGCNNKDSSNENNKTQKQEAYVGSYIIDFEDMKESIKKLEERKESTQMMKKMIDLFEGMSIEIKEKEYSMMFMDEKTSGKINKLNENTIELIPNVKEQRKFTAKYENNRLLLTDLSIGVELELKKTSE